MIVEDVFVIKDMIYLFQVVDKTDQTIKWAKKLQRLKLKFPTKGDLETGKTTALIQTKGGKARNILKKVFKGSWMTIKQITIKSDEEIRIVKIKENKMVVFFKNREAKIFHKATTIKKLPNSDIFVKSRTYHSPERDLFDRQFLKKLGLKKLEEIKSELGIKDQPKTEQEQNIEEPCNKEKYSSLKDQRIISNLKDFRLQTEPKKVPSMGFIFKIPTSTSDEKGTETTKIGNKINICELEDGGYKFKYHLSFENDSQTDKHQYYYFGNFSEKREESKITISFSSWQTEVSKDKKNEGITWNSIEFDRKPFGVNIDNW